MPVTAGGPRKVIACRPPWRGTSIEADPVDEARRILKAAERGGVVLRLLGGVAVFLRCPSASQAPLQRNYVDVDLIGHASQGRAIKALFASLGYTPREVFNRVQGDKRLIFNDLEHQRRVDIFLDVFEMCHKFAFRDRLEIDPATLALADLLATKLQIVEMNEKDMRDIACILNDHDLGSEDGALVNGRRIAELASRDWGVYKTFTWSLERVGAWLPSLAIDEGRRKAIRDRIDGLKRLMEDAPKTMKWKLRAAVGPSVRWYELPERDKEVVDSRVM